MISNTAAVTRPKPSARRTELSHRIDSLLASFLAADPRGRFASAAEAAAGIARVAAAKKDEEPKRKPGLTSSIRRLLGLAGGRR